MQVSIVNYCECRRIDFGHLLFSPEFFMDDKLKLWNDFEDKSTNASFDYFEHVRDTVQQINQPSICYDLSDGIPKFLDKELETTSIGSTKKIAQPNDFVISRLRSYLEEMAIVEDKQSPQLFSTEFLVFRAKTEKISTHTLFALCMTKQVQAILKRGQYGTEHPRFYDFLLTNLPIPDYLLMMDSYIVKYINDAIKIRKESKLAYQLAQDFLLAELGLDDWKPTQKLWCEKCYSETVEAGRIDAEYYQPKYDEIIKAITEYSGGSDRLGNLCDTARGSLISESFYTDSLGKVYIRGADFSGGTLSKNKAVYINKEFTERGETSVKEGDIVFSLIGSVGETALVTKEFSHSYISNNTGKISCTNGINPVVLQVLLKSIIGKMYFEKYKTQTAQPKISDKDTHNFVLPLLPEHKQLEIQEKVMESFELRERSKTLLEKAKRAVEMAIEQDETAAIQFLNSET